MNWLRLYTETKDDPKIGSLTDSEFRTFIEALCWAAQVDEGGNTGITEEAANWAFRRNVTSDVSSLLQKRLLTVEKTGTLSITNWEKRQPKSQNSTARVTKHREKTRVNGNGNVTETLQKRSRNGPEERRGEENREEKIICPAEFVEAWNALPKPFPKIRETNHRKTALAARQKDSFWRDNWVAAMQKLVTSEFCSGQNNQGWIADADWFLRPDTVVKIIEGKYDTRTITPCENGFVESDMPQEDLAEKLRAGLAAAEDE